MQYRVKKGCCAGHARCAAVAPAVYELDDDGFLRDSANGISAEVEELARRGARACPERAIELIED